jgi:microcystin-dependent protein
MAGPTDASDDTRPVVGDSAGELAQTLRNMKTRTNLALANANAAAAAAAVLVPAGAIISFAGNFTPAGWLHRNGIQLSRATYAALFAAIGTMYGPGDGSNTFDLPDLRGEFLRGHDSLRGVDGGRVFGSNQGDGVYIPGSFHATVKAVAGGSDPDPAFTGGWQATEALGQVNLAGAPTDWEETRIGVNTGAGETRPRNVAIHFLIKT